MKMDLTRPWTDLLSALGLLSRLPLPAHEGRGAPAAWAYPLAGAVLGGPAALAGLLALALSLPPQLAALICLGTSVMVTGALHEDGLADVADGVWGGFDRARRLEIMKDSRIGAYGVIALVLSLLARWSALSLLFATPGAAWAVIAAAALSRAAMPALMAALPHARDTGLSRAVGRCSVPVAALAAFIGAVLALILLGWIALPALLVAALVTLALARIASAKLGGQTGDVLGAAQQLAEIAVLLVLIA
ncbi:Cobalamin synthase [Pseudooceanicola marinus]|uniref:Adenosylcobinamide-GDP ribazoletransferase n=1 Tax=Pseudooceanicola marinus TaxID=396013 RepID=A0A1X6YUE1_9RHOB|nr:adenosylcobinamide-GDP ribazoletransferase [Pseudooceanicola marinus]PJE26204.1 adenosylcobinamide-GDP ribazoletransferase [Pseudooceanicola marinus]SLN31225.1 Cobalamin synthase [Pseudooceanicola marinus]